jgi:hypothetical protein
MHILAFTDAITYGMASFNYWIMNRESPDYVVEMSSQFKFRGDYRI